MAARVDRLFEVFDRLFAIKEECSSEIFCECGLDDITSRQIDYLKVIDEHRDVTFSRLAEITKNSKPTITEMACSVPTDRDQTTEGSLRRLTKDR